MIFIGLSFSLSIDGLKDKKLNFLSAIHLEWKFSSKISFLIKSKEAK